MVPVWSVGCDWSWPGNRPRVSPDGTKILCRAGLLAQIFDAQTGELLRSFREADNVQKLEWFDGGRRIGVALDGESSLRWRDADTGASVGGSTEFGDTAYAGGVAASPDGRLLALPLSGAPEFTVLDTANAHRLYGMGADACRYPRRLAWAGDSAHLVAVCDDGLVEVWDVASGQTVHQTRTVGSGGPLGEPLVALSVDGTWLALAEAGASDVFFERVGVPGQRRLRTKNSGVHDLTFGVGSSLVAATESGLRRWDLEGPPAGRTLRTALDVVQFAAEPWGRWAVVRTASSELVTIDLESGATLLRQPVLAPGGASVAASPGGGFFATFGDGHPAIWASDPPRLLHRLSEDTGSLALGPGGTWVARAWWGGELRLLHVPTGEERILEQDKRDKRSSLPAMAFSADGRTLAVAWRGEARLYAVRTGEEIVRQTLADETFQQPRVHWGRRAARVLAGRRGGQPTDPAGRTEDKPSLHGPALTLHTLSPDGKTSRVDLPRPWGFDSIDRFFQEGRDSGPTVVDDWGRVARWDGEAGRWLPLEHIWPESPVVRTDSLHPSGLYSLGTRGGNLLALTRHGLSAYPGGEPPFTVDTVQRPGFVASAWLEQPRQFVVTLSDGSTRLLDHEGRVVSTLLVDEEDWVVLNRDGERTGTDTGKAWLVSP